MNVSRTAAALTATTAALTGLVLIAPAANASGGTPDVRSSGTCTVGATWKLKAKPDDGGRLEVEYQLDTNRNNQSWAVKINDNTHRVFTGTRTTKAPSGSFSVTIHPVNRAGTDHLVATATRGAVTCTGRLAL